MLVITATTSELPLTAHGPNIQKPLQYYTQFLFLIFRASNSTNLLSIDSNIFCAQTGRNEKKTDAYPLLIAFMELFSKTSQRVRFIKRAQDRRWRFSEKSTIGRGTEERGGGEK